MALALKRVKVYLKLIAVLAVVAMVLLVVLKNLDHKADVWFFWIDEQVNVLWLILVTAVSSIVGWWAIRKVFGVLRELRDVRRMSEAEMKLGEQRRLAQELAEREKRLDAKVRRSISEEV